MAQKKNLFAKVFNRLRGSSGKNRSQKQSEEQLPPRPSTAPSRDAPEARRKSTYKRNPPPPILINNLPEEAEACTQSGSDEPVQPRRRQTRNEKHPERPRTAPSSGSRRITIAAPPPVPDISSSSYNSQRNISRRTSLKQRFWSASPSNHFHELDDDRNSAGSSSGHRSVYIPRHAATDFSKTALARRTSVHARANERIARRFSATADGNNDDDDKTLCSINCREEQDPETISRDLDLWLATLRRQQVMQQSASSTAGDSADLNRSNPPSPLPPLTPSGTSFNFQGAFATSSASNYSYAAATESENSDEEYGVFGQQPEAKAHSDAASIRRARSSVLIRPNSSSSSVPAIPDIPDDPILHRSSTYCSNPLALPPSPRRPISTAVPLPGRLPASPINSARPISTVNTFGGLSPGSYLEPSRPRSIMRTKSEKRRSSCAKTPAVKTVVEAA